MTLPVRLKGTRTRVNIDRAMIEYYATLPKVEDMEEKPQFTWWEMAIVAFILVALIFAVFHTAEAQIVRGMV